MSLDREKYLQILKSEGYHSAVTRLHRDMAVVEYQAFEGDRAHEPEKLAELNAMRAFSRELWDISLRDPLSAEKQG